MKKQFRDFEELVMFYNSISESELTVMFKRLSITTTRIYTITEEILRKKYSSYFKKNKELSIRFDSMMKVYDEYSIELEAIKFSLELRKAAREAQNA